MYDILPAPLLTYDKQLPLKMEPSDVYKDSIMYSSFIHRPPIFYNSSNHVTNSTNNDLFLLGTILDDEITESNVLPWRQDNQDTEEPILSVHANDTIYSQSIIEQHDQHHRQIINLRSKLDASECHKQECLDYYNHFNDSNNAWSPYNKSPNSISSSLSVSRSHCAYLIRKYAKIKDTSSQEDESDESIGIPSEICCDNTIRDVETQSKCMCRTTSWIANSQFHDSWPS